MRMGKSRIKLLDFQVYGNPTNPLLFQYAELQKLENEQSLGKFNFLRALNLHE